MSEISVIVNIREAIEADKEKPNLGMVDIHRARELIEEAGAVLLDVRPPAKVEGENAEEANVPNAYYVPVVEFPQQFEEGRIPQDRTAPIVVGCKLVKFANRVMGYLEALGYKNVYVLDTDIKDLIELYKAKQS
ncbi:rhodanese-like domain-containing protein [Persephonella atlantica]|uniref:Rhodanese-like domain-containing protein n=1 Tax=Persephonella atlantica TaxID=2699429 RepID=A0ABS1GI43_9AQUI|nr:rhodanese-like domain-containing protein [Persephonella atlantica]MBK3332613.1 rhodanese-like domain-containing protein [Persephonella atlantica]